MENISPEMMIDAVPQSVFRRNIKPQYRRENHIFNTVLDKFSLEDYKSLLFLLMDKLNDDDEFLELTKKEKNFLKQRVVEMRLEEEVIVELLGTMKKYKDLKCLGTCKHIFLSKEDSFDEISDIWKVLYTLCEEITDKDLNSLIKYLPDNFRKQVSSAEEWFYFALKSNVFTKTDVSGLKDVFKENQECLNIINNFKGSKIKSYHIKTPTDHSPCGYALIFNFETFSVPKLKKREGSQIDVDLLKKLWNTFGFVPDVYENLTSEEVFEVLERFSSMDHSNFDAFVCCTLSHGESNVIYASDGIPVSISKLINTISNNCLSLNHKPKLFFFQACQGTMIYQGVGKPEYDISDKQDSPTSNLPLDKSEPMGCDVNVVFSTVDQGVSFRDPSTGSLFVKALCEVMLECGHENSLTDVMLRVTDKVSKIQVPLNLGMPINAKQIVRFTSTLPKKVILKKKA